MSEGKGTQYERTRGAILFALFMEYEEGTFSRLGFEKCLDKIGIGDERTVRKYWKKLGDMGYIRHINANTSRLSQEIIQGEGRILSDDEFRQLIAPEAVR